MPANTDIIIDEWWMAIIFLKKLHFVKDFLNISTKLMNSGALVVETNFRTYGVNGKKILSPSSKDTLTASRDLLIAITILGEIELSSESVTLMKTSSSRETTGCTFDEEVTSHCCRESH